MYIITLLRHGYSLADDEKKFEGRYDSPLTEKGINQAEQLAERWKTDPRRKYNKIICSPLKRAHKTALIINQVLQTSIEIHDQWMERDNGKLAGLTREQGKQLYPMPGFSGPYDRIAAGSGESVVQTHTRALNAIEQLINREEGAYLIVSHGNIINAALRGILNIPMLVNYSGAGFRLGDTGHIDLSYNKQSHKWTVLALTNPQF